MQNSDNILQVENISKQFGSLKAVDQVSIQVKKGECFALLGPNGAGKTTTCEMIEGLLENDGGKISIKGLNYKSDRKKIQEIIGVQLQETNLYKKYTVLETLQLFASFYKSAQDPEAIITEMGLDDKKNTRLENLSGGQKQRVYLGCAIINNPEILFLDEPTTGLDPQSRRKIWETVEAIKKKNRGIVLTTHYMEEAEQLADRVAIIDHGKIITEGTPQELIKKYCKDGVINVSFDDANDLQQQKGKLSEKLNWFSEAKILEKGFEVVSQDVGSHVQDLTRTSDQLNMKMTSLTMRQGTLEDVFILVTGRSIRDD